MQALSNSNHFHQLPLLILIYLDLVDTDTGKFMRSYTPLEIKIFNFTYYSFIPKYSTGSFLCMIHQINNDSSHIHSDILQQRWCCHCCYRLVTIASVYGAHYSHLSGCTDQAVLSVFLIGMMTLLVFKVIVNIFLIYHSSQVSVPTTSPAFLDVIFWTIKFF